MINWRDVILSQYANSPRILALLEQLNEWIDPQADFNLFYNVVWNLDTAVGYGLDVWGRIVGVGRVLTLTTTPKYFGFATGSTTSTRPLPFGQAPFYVPGAESNSNYALGDPAYRRLIYIKALANICNCSIPAINILLQLLFADRGRCYVSDLGGMAMRYTFEFTLTPSEIAVLAQSRALVRPTGVLATLLQIPRGATFAFREFGTKAEPFGQGTFVSQQSVAGEVTPLSEILVGWDNQMLSGYDGQTLTGHP